MTFELMQEKTKIPQSTISSAVYRLKEGKSVTTKTLNMLKRSLRRDYFFYIIVSAFSVINLKIFDISAIFFKLVIFLIDFLKKFYHSYNHFPYR